MLLVNLNLFDNVRLDQRVLASTIEERRQDENCFFESVGTTTVTVMPFGLSRVPTTFQIILDQVLRGQKDMQEFTWMIISF